MIAAIAKNLYARYQCLQEASHGIVLSCLYLVAPSCIRYVGYSWEYRLHRVKEAFGIHPQCSCNDEDGQFARKVIDKHWHRVSCPVSSPKRG